MFSSVSLIAQLKAQLSCDIVFLFLSVQFIHFFACV